jgi:predicted nucleotide-binding protein
VPRINPELFERIRRKLNVGRVRAYQLIAAKAGELHVPRNLAAVQLAAENGINVAKRAYATDEERAQLRGLGGGATRAVAPVPAEPPRSSTPARRGRRGAVVARGATRKSNSVMVVYGRDSGARDALFTFLRAIALQPIEWPQAVRATKKGAPYVGEVLDAAFRQAAAVVVLLTPDDDAVLRKVFRKSTDPPFERRLTGQARPNVLFEAGRAFGSHPDATILVQLGKVRPFSDTAGVHVIHLTQGPEPRRDLANRLEAAGCAIDISGTDWLRAGDFSGPTK